MIRIAINQAAFDVVAKTLPGGSAVMDKIEIVYFETDGGVRLGLNRPTVISKLTYCEWQRNGTDEFAKATDRSFTKTGEGEWGYIPNDVRETLAVMIAPSIVETLRPFAFAADWPQCRSPWTASMAYPWASSLATWTERCASPKPSRRESSISTTRAPTGRSTSPLAAARAPGAASVGSAAA